MSAGIGALIGRVGPSHWKLFRLTMDVPYSPLFWGSGLLIGFLLNRRTLSRAACWVWVGGAVWLAIGMLDSYSPPGSHPWYNPPWCPPAGCSFVEQVKDGLFDLSGDKCGGSECLGEFIFTTPVFASVAYSLGAWLGLRSKQASVVSLR